MKYTLTYARVVILETAIEAESLNHAKAEAHRRECAGELGLEVWGAKDGSEVREVQDYDAIWEITLEDATIHLHDIDGINRLSGTDQFNRCWKEFEVDHFAGQLPGECSICGAELESGWLCLEMAGLEICDEHVEIES